MRESRAKGSAASSCLDGVQITRELTGVGHIIIKFEPICIPYTNELNSCIEIIKIFT